MGKKNYVLKKTENPTWIFTHEGVEYGPMNDKALCSSADSGLLYPIDEVRRSDIEEPMQAREVEGLFPEESLPSAIPAGLDDDSAPTNEQINQNFQPDIVGSGSVTCVHCWYRFDPEDALYITRHPDLSGDPVLGAGEQQRFLPSRFTPEGHAIDSEGLICPEVACPRCHMRLPRSLLALKPLFVSLVGAPASGKSYFLASMSWKLRTTLPEHFLINFSDSDGAANQWLSDYEERLFVQANKNDLHSIDKTELRGDLYKEVVLNGMRMSLPLPSIFTLKAERDSLYHCKNDDFVDRSLVLYDNAGEHFQPGADSAADPGTQHLLHAEALFFVLDPTKDPSFRRSLSNSSDPQLQIDKLVQRQDTVFTETLNRIRLHLGIDGVEQYERPVVILLSKSDLFDGHMSEMQEEDPWLWCDKLQTQRLDISHIMNVSFEARALINRHTPEVIKAVEAFASDVIYLPVSALGCSPMPDPSHTGDPGSALLVVRTGDISPKWVEVPMLYTLFKLGYIGGVAQESNDFPEPEECEIRGNIINLVVPGTDHRLRIPRTYASYVIRDPDTDVWFRVPEL
jgi:hypothetical protein